MDFEKLAKEILSDEEINNINTLWRSLENKEYEVFYNINKNIICEMLLVNSYSDFLDFLEDEKINKTIFMCAWMEKNGKCIGIGGYEENIENKIILFLKRKINSITFLDTVTREKIFTDFDDEDNFKDYIRKINLHLVTQNLQFVLFFNDIYVQCSYYLFLFDNKITNSIIKGWNNVDIELVLL